MKKIFSVLFAAALVLSCGSGPKTPDFARKPPVKDGKIYGVGYAVMADRNMAEQTAAARARTAISQQLNSVVRNMFDDYTASDENQKTAFVQNVTRILSESRLVNNTIEETFTDEKDGRYYSWVLVSIEKPDSTLSDKINKEKLNYAEFKNWNAQKEMDDAFSKQANGKPVTVDSN